jgi:hypothetical protein
MEARQGHPEVLCEEMVAEEPPPEHARVPPDRQKLVVEVERGGAVIARPVGPGDDAECEEDRARKQRAPAGEGLEADVSAHAHRQPQWSGPGVVDRIGGDAKRFEREERRQEQDRRPRQVSQPQRHAGEHRPFRVERPQHVERRQARPDHQRGKPDRALDGRE